MGEDNEFSYSFLWLTFRKVKKHNSLRLSKIEILVTRLSFKNSLKYGLITCCLFTQFVTHLFILFQETGTRLVRLKVIAGHNLAKKDIFGASDPYVKVDLLRSEDNSVIDVVYTRTKKRVNIINIWFNYSKFF